MMKKSIYKILFVIAIIIFLIIVVPLVLFTSSPNVDSKMSVDNETPVKEQQIGGLFIEFENGTIEPEVKNILKNCNVPVNYTIDYDSNYMLKRYYITVDQDKRIDVINELKKYENLTDHTEIKKGNYNIIVLPEEFIPDKKFLTILEKNNLQLKKSINCYVHFKDESKYWIPEKDAVRIKNELEINKKVLIVSLDNLKY